MDLRKQVTERPCACDSPPPPELLRGIEQFNRQEYFEQHETLEAIWIAEEGDVRYLYQGILQVGVAFYHLRRGNWVGACKLLDNGMRYLRAFLPACLGVDVAALVQDAEHCRQRLAELGPERARELTPDQWPRVPFTIGSEPGATASSRRAGQGGNDAGRGRTVDYPFTPGRS